MDESIPALERRMEILTREYEQALLEREASTVAGSAERQARDHDHCRDVRDELFLTARALDAARARLPDGDDTMRTGRRVGAAASDDETPDR